MLVLVPPEVALDASALIGTFVYMQTQAQALSVSGFFD